VIGNTMTRSVFLYIAGILVPHLLTAASSTFVQGVNLGGPATTVEGNTWLSMSEAVSRGLTYTNALIGNGVYSFSLIPLPDPGTQTVLNSALFRPNPPNGTGFQISQPLTSGDYLIYVWTLENLTANSRNMTVVA